MRRSLHRTQKTENHSRIKDAVSISERPATAEDRAVPRLLEGDLLFGSHNSHIYDAKWRGGGCKYSSNNCMRFASEIP